MRGMNKRFPKTRQVPQNEQVRRWTIIYGFVLISAFFVGYKIVSPDHQFFRSLDSWQNFMVFCLVCLVMAFVARAIAIWQFKRK